MPQCGLFLDSVHGKGLLETPKSQWPGTRRITVLSEKWLGDVWGHRTLLHAKETKPALIQAQVPELEGLGWAKSL